MGDLRYRCNLQLDRHCPPNDNTTSEGVELCVIAAGTAAPPWGEGAYPGLGRIEFWRLHLLIGVV